MIYCVSYDDYSFIWTYAANKNWSIEFWKDIFQNELRLNLLPLKTSEILDGKSARNWKDVSHLKLVVQIGTSCNQNSLDVSEWISSRY